MQNLIFYLITLFISTECFPQLGKSEAFSQKLDEQKNNFRDKGLINLDKLEGIYFLEEIQDWKFGDAAYSGKIKFERCFLINKLSPNFFYLSYYDDSTNNFMRNGVYIIKNGDR